MVLQQRKKLGDILKEANIVQEEDIVKALEERKPNQKLGDALVEQGYITEKQLLEVLEIHLNIPSISLFRYPIDEKLIELIPKNIAMERVILPIQLQDNVLVLAMNDPMDYFTIEDVELSTGFNVRPVIATRNDILQTASKLYDMGTEWNLDVNPEDNNSVIRLLDQILQTGVVMQASDIHLDPLETGVTVRYRVDGILHIDKHIPKSIQSALTARVKIMSNLNVTETRLPQDGRIRIMIDNKPFDLRVSTLPTIHGEKVVMRILDLTNALQKINEIDLSNKNEKILRNTLKKPSGLVLVTGPTGSGKTTTLYAAINELNQEGVNIVTIEDPVEYQMDGVNQVQVNSAIGLTFAKGLRTILRQDPNIIMVGEIRDQETAEIAIRSALTGHLVFSTIHTNSAIAAIPRLIDMGIEPYLILSSLVSTIAQRLVKKICPDCKQKRPATTMEKDIFQRHGMDIDELYYGTGCNQCKDTGYRGRMAIHEIFEITPTIREEIQQKPSIAQLKDIARGNGMTFLIEDGLQKVKTGVTTLEEVLKVVNED